MMVDAGNMATPKRHGMHRYEAGSSTRQPASLADNLSQPCDFRTLVRLRGCSQACLGLDAVTGQPRGMLQPRAAGSCGTVHAMTSGSSALLGYIDLALII